uniref:Phospholipid/glycerol acyltransferase domain-containing protein n=1 Tax=Haptolina brevifila TaxID=156173 RepID=A0A7S2D0N1_9EUKA
MVTGTVPPLRHHVCLTSHAVRQAVRCQPPLMSSVADTTFPQHEPPPPLIPRLSIRAKGQTFTPPGVLLGFSVFATAFIVQIPVFLCYLWALVFDRKRRRGIDWVIHFWARVSMTICGYRPEVVGLENLDGLRDKNCLFVPNHTSFLDILTLTGFIPMPMKYVSKSSILKIPLIGWPMLLAGHIALQTESRRSQLQTFKDTVQALEDGNSVITFPEGGRSTDGTLKPFKRGPFKMAMRSGVPIVPVSICGLAQWYPKGTLLPYNVPKGVRVVIHAPIDPSEGRTEGELCDRSYNIVNSALPDYQRGPPLAA